MLLNLLVHAFVALSFTIPEQRCFVNSVIDIRAN